MTGAQYTLSLEASDPISAAKLAIEREAGIPADQQRLIYQGKCLEDSTQLCYYNIMENATLHIVLRLMPVEPDTLSQRSSTPGSINLSGPTSTTIDDRFDDDEHILDPQAYYSKMKAIEKETVEGSSFFRSGGKYRPLELRVFDPWESKDIRNIPNPLRIHLEYLSSPHALPGLANTVDRPEVDNRWEQERAELAYLYQGYFTICRVLQLYSTLQRSKFCTSFFSLLRLHKQNDVAEIVRLRPSLIQSIKLGIEGTITHIVENGGIRSFKAALRQYVEIPCTVLLEDAGIMPAKSRPRNIESILTLCYMTATLLDMALVSYVGSHGSPFCAKYLGRNDQMIEVQGKSEDDFSFRCVMQPLACLHGFLDGGTAWVFQFSPSRHLPLRTGSPTKLSILAKMEDFADIWGPVWTIPAGSGLIKGYNVSKGVICRLENRRNIFNAVPCHWYSWASFHRRRVSKLLTRSGDLLLAGGDLLLIGAVFRQNSNCHYTLGDYEAEYGNSMGILGTTPSYWKADSRGLSLGLSKVVGVTVSGTQKLIPQTSLKQHILDKWTNNATRANSGVLNQSLGVEISNCTGNARRIPIKSMMLLQAVSPLLERQIPQWTRSLWGSSFLAALGDTENPKAVYDVWMKFPENRIQMAELVCCALEVLNSTGLGESDFLAGFLHDGQESSVSLDYKRNHWARLLEDSHLTAVYAVINEVCLECQLPNHSAMTCTSSDAYTVLQTEVRFDSDPRYDCERMALHRKLYQRADAGSDRIFLFKPKSQGFSIRSKSSAVTASELLNQPGSRYCLDIYLRASSRSHHGRDVLRRRIFKPARKLVAGREVRTRSRLDVRPVQAPSFGLGEQFDRDRRSWQGMRSHAHSPDRRPAVAAEGCELAEMAHGLIHDMRNYVIDDTMDDTQINHDDSHLYPENVYRPRHIDRPQIDDNFF